jgi:hypothetical protein
MTEGRDRWKMGTNKEDGKISEDWRRYKKTESPI